MMAAAMSRSPTKFVYCINIWTFSLRCPPDDSVDIVHVRKSIPGAIPERLLAKTALTNIASFKLSKPVLYG